MKADAFITCLSGVKSTGKGRWIARCPAHEDRSPSLSVRELDDGRVLVHCFANCEAQHVLEAVGMTFADLFPDSDGSHYKRGVRHNPYDLLEILRREATIATLAADDLRSNKPLNDEDHQRLLDAVARIVRVVNGTGR